MAITFTLPPRPRGEQMAFNVERWKQLCTDPELAKLDHRIETDRYGHIIMTPPPAPNHGSYQTEIAALLRAQMGPGRIITECPISTSDGVKSADVGWISKGRFAPMDGEVCLTIAPEICVEVLSPSNTAAEMDEKRLLYFEAGAEEVWFCSEDGVMRFVGTDGPLEASALCPGFPSEVELPQEWTSKPTRVYSLERSMDFTTSTFVPLVSGILPDPGDTTGVIFNAAPFTGTHFWRISSGLPLSP